MVMVRIFKDHRHSIVGEKQPSPFHRLEKLTIAPVYIGVTNDKHNDTEECGLVVRGLSSKSLLKGPFIFCYLPLVSISTYLLYATLCIILFIVFIELVGITNFIISDQTPDLKVLR